jgi:mRNA interferase MazF
MVEKVRPVLILSVPFAADDRAVLTVVFHSTSLRGSRFEIPVNAPFLKKARSLSRALPPILSPAP